MPIPGSPISLLANRDVMGGRLPKEKEIRDRIDKQSAKLIGEITTFNQEIAVRKETISRLDKEILALQETISRRNFASVAMPLSAMGVGAFALKTDSPGGIIVGALSAIVATCSFFGHRSEIDKIEKTIQEKNLEILDNQGSIDELRGRVSKMTHDLEFLGSVQSKLEEQNGRLGNLHVGFSRLSSIRKIMKGINPFKMSQGQFRGAIGGVPSQRENIVAVPEDEGRGDGSMVEHKYDDVVAIIRAESAGSGPLRPMSLLLPDAPHGAKLWPVGSLPVAVDGVTDTRIVQSSRVDRAVAEPSLVTKPELPKEEAGQSSPAPKKAVEKRDRSQILRDLVEKYRKESSLKRKELRDKVNAWSQRVDEHVKCVDQTKEKVDQLVEKAKVRREKIKAQRLELESFNKRLEELSEATERQAERRRVKSTPKKVKAKAIYREGVKSNPNEVQRIVYGNLVIPKMKVGSNQKPPERNPDSVVNSIVQKVVQASQKSPLAPVAKEPRVDDSIRRELEELRKYSEEHSLEETLNYLYGKDDAIKMKFTQMVFSGRENYSHQLILPLVISALNVQTLSEVNGIVGDSRFVDLNYVTENREQLILMRIVQALKGNEEDGFIPLWTRELVALQKRLHRISLSEEETALLARYRVRIMQ